MPINSNLPAANTEKSPKVDDCCTKISFMIDKEIDDPPHVVTGDTVDFPTHHAFDVFIVEHHRRDGVLGGRRRRSRFRDTAVVAKPTAARAFVATASYRPLR